MRTGKTRRCARGLIRSLEARLGGSVAFLVAAWFAGAAPTDSPPVAPGLMLEVPTAAEALHLSIPLGSKTLDANADWFLCEVDGAQPAIPVDRWPADRETQPVPSGAWLAATVPVSPGHSSPRRFELRQDAGVREPSRFRWADVDDRSLGLWEGDRPVLVYNHGVMSRAGVPADRNRSTYLHPIYGLDGEVLTDDFPEDHHHHRGLFWAWPHVKIAGQEYDLWMLKGIEQRFERWLLRGAGQATAVLEVENGWYVGQRKVISERASFQVYRASGGVRAVDVSLVWIPVGEAVTLAGAEGKSYGGLTLRFGPATNTVITTPLGTGGDDLLITRLPWADLSARFGGRDRPSGAAIFVSPNHPDYPPTWLTRHYGVLCLGWPGVEPQTFPAGKPLLANYRLWIHRAQPDTQTLRRAYDTYTAGLKARWVGNPLLLNRR